MSPNIDRKQLFGLLNGLRRVLLQGLVCAAILSAGSFFFARRLLLLFANHSHTTLYYFTLSEVFFSAVEVAIYAGLFLSVPLIMALAWREFRGALTGRIGRSYLFVVFAVLLFYLGSAFCYFVVLPNSVTFLISYQGGPLKAMISTDRFIHFFIAMVFAFGGAFELPVVLLLLGKLGVVKSKMLTRTRRYALLLIVIAAAVITPTPDIYNMSLLAVPLYVLYEIGILLLKIGERRAGVRPQRAQEEGRTEGRGTTAHSAH